MNLLAAAEVMTKHRPTLITSSITGLPGHPVQGVTLKNISILYGGVGGVPRPGDASLANLAKVPECEKRYPQGSMFGVLPSWGFYCRHAEGIIFDNVSVRVRGQDYRPCLLCDDVRDLELEGFRAESAGSEPVIVLNDVHGAAIGDSVAPAGAGVFIKKMGNTRDVQER
jgi:hypothetical protein